MRTPDAARMSLTDPQLPVALSGFNGG